MASPFYLKHRERTACPGSCLVFFARAGSAFIRLHAWICEHLALVSSLTLVMLLCAAVGKYAMQDAGGSQHVALILISVQNIFMVIFPMVCAIACTRLSPETATKLSSLAPSVFFVYVFHPIGIMLFYHSIPASIENSTLHSILKFFEPVLVFAVSVFVFNILRRFKTVGKWICLST